MIGTVEGNHHSIRYFYLSFVPIVSLLLVCPSEAMCPRACDCRSNHVWICANLTSLGDIWVSSPTAVEELTLTHLNDLSYSNDHLGASFVSVRRLKIKQSVIGSISESFVATFPNVELVTLEDNQFVCNDHILALRTWKLKINFSPGHLYCSSPDGLAGTELFLALKEIARVNEECPKDCRCVIFSLQSTYHIPNLIVDCSHSNLKVVPKSLPKAWVIHLDLSHNEISDATPLFTTPEFQNVSVLNVAHNRIHKIEVSNASSYKNRFRLLNLANNKLTQLPGFLVFDTENFSYQSLIMLRNNPWLCECRFVRTFQAIANEQLQIIGDFVHMTCGGALEGHSISSIATLEKVCKRLEYSMATMMIRCVNICCFILVGLAVIKTVFDLRSMYAVGIFHFFAHLLLPSR